MVVTRKVLAKTVPKLLGIDKISIPNRYQLQFGEILKTFVESLISIISHQIVDSNEDINSRQDKKVESNEKRKL